MERDILKKATAFFAKENDEIRVHSRGGGCLAGAGAVRFQKRLLRLEQSSCQQESGG
jgi:hypothetical protein